MLKASKINCTAQGKVDMEEKKYEFHRNTEKGPTEFFALTPWNRKEVHG